MSQKTTQRVSRDGKISEQHQRNPPAEAHKIVIFTPGHIKPESHEAEVGIKHRRKAPGLFAYRDISTDDIKGFTRILW